MKYSLQVSLEMLEKSPVISLSLILELIVTKIRLLVARLNLPQANSHCTGKNYNRQNYVCRKHI